MELVTNVIYCGDCLVKLKEIPDESIDLIYIDPPFSSNRNYVAFWEEQEKRHFEDRFENVRVYLDYMYPRVKELYRVLKPTGSFYYHCDWHASHYIKVMLDRDDLFGYNNFKNEIVWHYRRWTGRARKFQKLHDIILFYTKSDEYTFNEIIIPYTEGSVERKMGGILHRFKNGEEPYLVSERRLQAKGVPANDVFMIPFVAPSAKERLGYPTQKPLALLDRIIKVSSNEGDIILDAFCGCGTTLVASQRGKRQWIGIDISPTACRVMAKRLMDECHVKEGIDFCIRDLPKTIEELQIYPAFEFQNWVINALGGVPSKVKVRDGGIDGKLYPIEDIQKQKTKETDLFGDIDKYIPIQVKRTQQVGRPDIDNFETAMKRDSRNIGIFVGFDFSRDAIKEVRRAERQEGLRIEPVTVGSILQRELNGLLR